MRVTRLTPGASAKSFPAGMAHRTVENSKMLWRREPPSARQARANLLRRYAPGERCKSEMPPRLAADDKSGVCLRQAQRGATGFRAVPHSRRAFDRRHLRPFLSGCPSRCGHSVFVPVHDRNSVMPLSPRSRFWSAGYRGADGRPATSPDLHRPTATLFYRQFPIWSWSCAPCFGYQSLYAYIVSAGVRQEERKPRFRGHAIGRRSFHARRKNTTNSAC